MGIHKLNQKKHRLLSDRLFIVSIVVVGMFVVLVYQFYTLQIIEHAAYEEDLRASVQREVEIPAIRGLIYDRYGKPLVSNKPIYVLKTDPQVSLKKDDYNQILLNVANLLEENEDTYIDNMPISKTVPFTFTEDDQSIRSFITNYVPYDNQEHKELLYTYSAPELMAYLRGEKGYNLDSEISDEDARKILAMRLQISQTTYQKYKKVTLAKNISMETLAAIEEHQDDFPSIMAEVESERYYTETYSKAFGNILGYTRMITESQYNDLKDSGYEKDDLVGQVGIEGSMESELKGEKGSKLIEVDNAGRTVFTLETKEAKAGNDVYLTLDADLQLATYQAMEKRLAEGIVGRLQGKEKTVPLTGREILISMAKNNQLDFNIMKTAPQSQMQRQLYDKVAADYEKALNVLKEKEKNLSKEEKTTLTIKQHFANMLDSEEILITDRELLLALGEQESLKLDEDQMKRIWDGNIGSIEALLIAELESGELKPDQTAIMPFSGSAVVVDVNTGEVLALVGYPSYDSNEFTQNFNSIYRKLHDGVDERNIEINRALKTAKAPGSTFKMIVAVAGLEEEVVTPDTMIYDTGEYPNVGLPAPKCWIYTNTGHGHGSLNIQGALEVSCNYYFYDIAYRLGLKYGAPYGGIDALSKYVEMFGLSHTSGVELEETAPNISNPKNAVSTQAARALNYIKNMKDKKSENREKLLSEVQEYLDIFYTLGDSRATDLDGRIDYLTQSYIKKSLDSELAIVLSEDLSTIYDKVIEDIGDALQEGVNAISKEIADEVLARDSKTSLKLRTKSVVQETLESYIEAGTRKTITKTLDKMPQGVLEQAYYDGYAAAYKRYEDQEDMKDVCAELERRMAAIKEGSFNAQERTVSKVIDRILSVYVDDFFKDIHMEWNVSDNVRTAIGQGGNTFTPVQMARYVAGLANGHTVYDLKVVSGIDDHKITGDYTQTPEKVFNTLNFKESTLTNIYEGMHKVATGSAGTARSYFTDFPIQVAAKTGTAQEGKYENSWFVGFAPYDKPEIAVVTSMYGADGLGGSNTQLAKDVFEAYFKIGQEKEKVTLGNKFVQ
ncbi:penicillin-binding transpeptidase domain-containing protein [Cellulosilyticum lentocellum]|nr:penicillin-binding transpeptidase domain-containing protein [Cellulosilyticum lentocellum]